MVSGSRLDELLDQWEEALGRGEVVTPEQLCVNDPELKEALTKQIDALIRIRDKFEALSKSQIPGGSAEDMTNVPSTHEGETLVTFTTDVKDLKIYATGGLGKIYSGNDNVLHRDVAVKFLQKQYAARPRMLERFVAEAEITSRLDHPNIVPVHGFGWTSESHPFYVMRLIRGESLDAEIDRFHSRQIRAVTAYRGSDFRDLVQRLKDTCNAIAYAHSRGIVHLDIKPQNILLGKYGETVVVDWGLAATVGRAEKYRIDGEQTLNLRTTASNNSTSLHGGGTPAYMSPEQVVWKPAPGPSADVFCLGATLYKIATGRPPYRGQRQPKTVDQNLMVDYPLPREIQKHVPKPLQSIILKAMAMQPEKRYETASDLALDLDRYLGGARVTAHQETTSERFARYVNHHRRSSAMAAILTGILLLSSVISSLLFADMARKEAVSRSAAENLQRQTLAATAHYAAEMFAGEIQNRWTVLDKVASNPNLRDYLADWPNNADDVVAKEKLQAWLDSQFLYYRDLNPSSWFIVAADGTQIAVVPKRRPVNELERSEGENFKFRDYFHGLEKPFDKEVLSEAIKPIRSPHFSMPYLSTNAGKLRVALSVPIWRGDEGVGEPMGVLGMGTELGQMKMLENAILIDTRQDWLETTPMSGLVLQHPRLDQKTSIGSMSDRVNYRVPPEQLERLISAPGVSRLDSEFVDPLSNGQVVRPAAAAPVIVSDWLAHDGKGERNTGLIIVIMQPDQKLVNTELTQTVQKSATEK